MAKKNNNTTEVSTELTDELISSINLSLKGTRAYNLAVDESPTEIKRFISTGSVLLDYIISNRRDGGVPEGRLLEVAGQSSTGKSFIALNILRNTQKIGGIAILLDTENATDKTLLESLGVDINRLIYIQPKYIEEVFEIIEHTIKKAKEVNSDRPITVVWDSVAATPPRTELDGDYDQNTVGLGARIVSKGLRKITQFIAENRVTLVFTNQLKMKVNLANKYEDPYTTPYGLAIPYHASVRLQLTRVKSSDMHEDEEKDSDFLGVGVKAKVIKNKIAPPFRTCEFSIEFYKGIQEHQQLFLALIKNSPVDIIVNNKKYNVNFTGGLWHSCEIKDDEMKTAIKEQFRKSEITQRVFENNELKPYLNEAIDAVLHKDYSKQELPDDLHMGEVEENSNE